MLLVPHRMIPESLRLKARYCGGSASIPGAILAQVACLVLALGVLVSQAADPFPPDIKKIKDRGKIVVAQCSTNQPGFYWFDDKGTHQNEPFFMYKGRRLIGTDIAMAMNIAEALGVELELIRSSGDFNSVCLQVARGNADIAISKLSITLERAQYVRFTRPYAVLGSGLLVNRFLEARAGPKTALWDLCNRPGTRIGVWKGTSCETYARDLFPRADIQLYDSFDKLFRAVIDREVFACLDEDFSLRLRLHEEPASALRVRFAQVPDKKDLIAIAVAPDSPNLLAFLNVFLKHKSVKINLEDLLRKTSRTKWKKNDQSGKRAGK
jgi:polar amino acid transport system substrate-binding protein